MRAPKRLPSSTSASTTTEAAAMPTTTVGAPIGQPNSSVNPVMPLLPPNPVSLRNISSMAT